MAQLGTMRGFIVGLAALLWSATGLAQSTLIGFDFGPAAGVPQNWNPVAGVGTFTGLVDEAGNPVPLSLTVSGTAVDNFPVVPLPETIPLHDADLSNLGGSIYTFEDRVELALSGLAPDTLYQLWVFGIRDIEGRSGPAFEQHVIVNGELRSTQSAENRVLAVNSRIGSNSVSLAQQAIIVRSDANGAMSIAVEDPGNLNILGGGVYLAGLALREWDGSRPFHSVPVMPLAGILLLSCLLGWVATRQRNLLR